MDDEACGRLARCGAWKLVECPARDNGSKSLEFPVSEADVPGEETAVARYRYETSCRPYLS